MDEAPPRVVALRRAGRNRCLAVLDDGREIQAHPEACQRLAVAPGDEASEAYLARLADAHWKAAAHDAAVALLARRARSEGEVRAHLARKGVPPAIVALEIERLRAAGLTDDEQFAAAWTRDRAALSPRSRRLVEQELRARGVAPEVARSAATAAGDDRETALTLARKRAARGTAGSREQFLARTGAFLARRGYAGTVAFAAARQAWDERPAAASDDAEQRQS